MGCFASSLQINVTLKTDAGLTKEGGKTSSRVGEKKSVV